MPEEYIIEIASTASPATNGNPLGKVVVSESIFSQILEIIGTGPADWVIPLPLDRRCQEMPDSSGKRLCIEFPSVGKTYFHNHYAVYAYDEYPKGSVLEGQERRTLIQGDYASLAEAQRDYPEAEYTHGSQYQEAVIPHEAPGWFDPEAAGEIWDESDAY